VVARSPERDPAATRSFFAARAAGWEDRFPDDGAAFARAIAELGPRPGGVTIDVGCGTGRALPLLREAVGPAGVVIGIDLTPEMLTTARAKGRERAAALVLADALRLPLAGGRVDAVLAAGLVSHLADAGEGLRELARVVAPGGRLALFHPIGRAALAARHGGVPADDDVRSAGRLPGLLAAAGWDLESLDDAEDRYLALAVRRSAG